MQVRKSNSLESFIDFALIKQKFVIILYIQNIETNFQLESKTWVYLHDILFTLLQKIVGNKLCLQYITKKLLAKDCFDALLMRSPPFVALCVTFNDL